jgi:D-alanyl-D-alanine carboxypeptidase
MRNRILQYILLSVLSIFIVLLIFRNELSIWWSVYNFRNNKNEASFNQLLDSLKSYSNFYETNNPKEVINLFNTYKQKNIIPLPEININTSETELKSINFKDEIYETKKLPSGSEIIIKEGKLGEERTTKYSISIQDEVIYSAETSEISKKAEDRIIHKGSETKDIFGVRVSDLVKQSFTGFSPIYIFNNYLSVPPVASQEKVLIGLLPITNTKCNRSFSVGVLYNPSTNQILFNNVEKIINLDCSKTQTHQVSCEDCAFAPVNKFYYLPQTYTPRLVDTGLPGGGQIAEHVQKPLQELFKDLEKNNLLAEVSYAHRSYEKQTEIFNTYTFREMQLGRDKATAEKIVNTYSARPGHSEHQLGTAVDIRCRECNSVTDRNVRNDQIYAHLENNAYKYGFVISYPRNCESQTGYVYEPWHIRYVGVELAEQIHKTNYFRCENNIYPGLFFEALGNY